MAHVLHALVVLGILSVFGALPTESSAAEPALRSGGSSRVLYAFPEDTDQLSVTPSGALSFGLRIPSFPAYLQPELLANYEGRAGPTELGNGFQIHVPRITLDLRENVDALTTSPSDQMVLAEGHLWIRDRWIGPGGDLVCDADARWPEISCTTEMRSMRRFVPIVDMVGGEPADYVSSWKVIDPLSGVTQTFGTSDASRILNDEGRPVAWLLDRETNQWGQEIRHFYEERKNEYHRRRVAVQYAGNKVTRFIYRRHPSPRSDYRLTVRREVYFLLSQIQLLSGCEPQQHDDEFAGIYTGFSGCDDSPHGGRIHRVVKLQYHEPEGRYTKQPALASWQEFSGDETVAYPPISFTYEGDDIQAPVVSEPSFNPALQLPDNQLFPTGHAYAPFTTLYDVGMNGIPDLITKKSPGRDADWPNLFSSRHGIHIHHGTGDGGFDSPAVYGDPFFEQAYWLLPAGSDYYKLFHDPNNLGDKPIDVLDSLVTAYRLPADQIADYATAAGWRSDIRIGIDARMFAHIGEAFFWNESPVSKSLSLALDCSKLLAYGHGMSVCANLAYTYACLWQDDCSARGARRLLFDPHSSISVTVRDHRDMNGDGYLDALVSGLLVVWEDGESRDPWAAPPAIYVSLFDPENDAFQPFVRYDIDVPAEFEDLQPAFLSALSVQHKFNEDATPGDGSAMSAVNAAAGIVGTGLQVVGALGSGEQPPSPTAAFDTGTMVGDVALSAIDIGTELAGARPEVLQAVSYAQQGLGALKAASGAYQAGHGLVEIAKYAEKVAASGWATIGQGAWGVVVWGTNVAHSHYVKRRLNKAGLNPGAVAANAQVTSAMIGVIGIAVGLTLGAVAAATFWIPIGWIAAALSLGLILYNTIRPNVPPMEFEDGSVYADFLPKRGVVYKPRSTPTHSSRSKILSNWVDLTGAGTPALVIGRSTRGSSDWAVARGDVKGLENGRAVARLARWPTQSSEVPDALVETETTTQFELRHVHRASSSDVRVMLLDMNGDGLMDLLDGKGTPWDGPIVHLNTGLGFDQPRQWTFADGGVSAPASCSATQFPPSLQLSRQLMWLESVSNESGYSLSLGNVILTMKDFNGDGLPDLTIKDESSYSELQTPTTCNFFGTVTAMDFVCRWAMPVVGEPGKYQSNQLCSGAGDWSNAWFGHLDYPSYNPLGTPGRGEGMTHLTKAAEQVFSPSHRGIHKVAFNTGSGFSSFEESGTELPSLSGSLSVTDVTTPTKEKHPDYAIGGTTNLLEDFDADGTDELVVLDINDYALAPFDTARNPQVPSAPAQTQYRIGIPNPDSLTSITYPDGDRVAFTYERKLDLSGRQGPPLWVLSSAVFDDKVSQAKWGGPLPSVSYEYTNGLMSKREFRGFEAIAETRFSGHHTTQLIQLFEQEGPGRGSVVCAEVRGSVNESAGDPLCKAEELGQTPLPARRAKAATESNSESCDVELGALGLGTIHPLLQKKEYTIDTSASIAAPDGEDDTLLRDVVVTEILTTNYEGGDTALWQKVKADYHEPPYRTPFRSTVTTSDGTSRVLETDWEHVDSGGEWRFLKTEERKVLADGATEYQRTEFDFQLKPPYALLATRECSPDDGCQREEEFDYEGSLGGLPTFRTDARGTTEYEYYEAGEDGTGLLKEVRRPTDDFVPDGGVEEYRYHVMGAVEKHRDASGVETEHHYDGLGVLEWELPPGHAAPIIYDHDLGYTVRTESIGGQERTTSMVFDGFGRLVEKRWHANGTRAVAMDFDSDGKDDYEAEFIWPWYDQELPAQLVQEYRRNATGGIQCTSSMYLDYEHLPDEKPGGWEARLEDSLGRTAVTKDYEGFERRTTRSVEEVDGTPYLREEATTGLPGERTVVRYDALNRKVSEDFSGLLANAFVYDPWDGLVETTNKAGYSTRYLRDAWQQPLEVCRQEFLDDPATDDEGCPASWPTEVFAYDDMGRLVSSTDAEGNTIEHTQAACGEVGRTVYPDEGGGRSYEEWTFDAACRPLEKRERNGSTTLFAHEDGLLVGTIRAAELPEESRTRIGHDELGRRLYVQNGRGFRTYTVLDFLDRPIETFAYPETAIDMRNPFDKDKLITTKTEYSVEGFPSNTTDADRHRVRLKHDLMGRLTAEEWDSEVCDATALAQGRFAVLPDVLHRRELVRDPKGRVETIRHTDGTLTTYQYDPLDREIRQYARSPRLAGPVDPNDPNDPDRPYIERTYDDAGNVESERDWNGVVTEYGYDGLGRLTDEWVPINEEETSQTQHEYYRNGLLKKTISPAAAASEHCISGAEQEDDFATEYTYTALGQLLETTFPADQHGVRHTEVRTYTKAGDLKTVTDARGNTTKYETDALGQVTTVTHPDDTPRREDNPTVQTTYDENGNVQTVTDELGLITSTTYDALDRPLEVHAPGGVITTTTWTPGGRLERSWVVGEEGIARHYTADGRLAAEWELDAGLSRTRLSSKTCYDRASRVRAVEQPSSSALGRTSVSQTTWDVRGRKIEDWPAPVPPWPSEPIEYAYHDEDLLVDEVRAPFRGPDFSSGPDTVVTTYERDQAGRVVAETFTQAATKRSWELDANGNVCATWEDEGIDGTELRRIDYQYDARGLMVSRVGVDDPGVDAEFAWNAVGDLEAAEDAHSAWNWAYDVRNRVETQHQTVKRLGLTFTTGLEYYANGLPFRLHYPTIPGSSRSPTEMTIVRERGSNRIDAVRTRLGDVATELHYDGADRVVELTMGNGATALTKYDELGDYASLLVASPSGTRLVDRAYVWDQAKNLESIDDHLDSTTDMTATYDPRRRLTNVDIPKIGGITEYQYNDQTLFDRVIRPSATNDEFEYNEHGNLSIKLPNFGFYYNEHGNRTQGPDSFSGVDATYQWDHLDRLVQAEAPGQYNQQFAYTHDGLLVEHEFVDQSDVVFLYGPNRRRPVAELVVRDGRIHVIDGESQVNWNVYLGERLAQTVDPSGTTRYYVTDYQGTPIASLDDQGNLLDSIAYDPWGNNLIEPAGPPTLDGTSIGFQGSYAVDGTSLWHMGHRFYDAATGQFASPDPLGLDAGPARYAFANANPLRYRDPDGTQSIDDGVDLELTVRANPELGTSWSWDPLSLYNPEIEFRTQAFLDLPGEMWSTLGPEEARLWAEASADPSDPEKWDEIIETLGNSWDVFKESHLRRLALARYGQARADSEQGNYLGAVAGGGIAALEEVGATVFIGETPQETLKKIATDYAVTLATAGTLHAAARIRGAATIRKSSESSTLRLQGGQQLKRLTEPRIGHTTPWAEMTPSQRRAFQHSYNRHAGELGLPNWAQTRAADLQRQFNTVVGHIREHGQVSQARALVRGEMVPVRRWEAVFDKNRYYYYETFKGDFVSAGLMR